MRIAQQAIKVTSHVAPQHNRHAPFFSSFIQPKLTINQPSDVYEQEANAMADQVMQMPDGFARRDPFFKSVLPVAQRTCAHCAEEEKELHLQRYSSPVQRKCKHCEEEELHRKEAGNESISPDADLDTYISSLDGGHSLSSEERHFFEPRFGYDFSQVRIHNNAAAHSSAAGIGAKAYTHRNHIVFGTGQYADSDEGKNLLAHELTHVIQQDNDTIKRDAAGAEIPAKPVFVVKQEIFNPDSGTIVFISDSGMRMRRQATENGKPHSGVYHFVNGKPDRLIPAEKLFQGPKGKDYIFLYDPPEEIVLNWLGSYDLTVLDTRLIKDYGIARLDEEQLAEITASTQDMSDLEIFQLTNPGKGKRVMRTFEEIKAALKGYQKDKEDFEIFEMDATSNESRLLCLEELYKNYIVYKCLLGKLNPLSDKCKDPLKEFLIYTISRPLSAKDYTEGFIKKFEAQVKQSGFSSVTDFENTIEQYKSNFITLALDISFTALDNLEFIIEKEAKRYAKGDDSKGIYDSLAPARVYDKAAKASEDDLQKQFARFGDYDQDKISETITGIEQQKADRDKTYGKAAESYPALQLMKQEDMLGKGKNYFTSKAFIDDFKSKRHNIEATRDEIKKDSAYFFKLDKLVALVYNKRGIQPGSIYDLIIKDKMQEIEDKKSLIDNVLFVLTIALALLTMGGGLLALGAEAGLAVIGTASAIEALDTYARDSTAYDINLMSDKPGVFWVAVAVLGAGLDMGSAFSAFSKTTHVIEGASHFTEDGFRRFVKDIEETNLLEQTAENARQYAAMERRMKDAVIRQAKLQFELDTSFTKAAGSLAGKSVLDSPELLRDLASQTIGKGYHGIEDLLLNLQRNGLIRDAEHLSADELLKVKNAYHDAMESQIWVKSGIKVEEAPVPDEVLNPDEAVPPAGAPPVVKAHAPEAAGELATLKKQIGSVNAETEEMLLGNDELRRAFLDNPEAAKILKLCESPCLPPFATPAQIGELEAVMKRTSVHNIEINKAELRSFFHEAKTPEELAEKIEELNGGFDRYLSDVSAGKKPFVLDDVLKADKMRWQPGMAHGGEHLADVTDPSQLFATGKGFGDGQIAQVPGQIARAMRESGKEFKNFKEFREEFWKMMEKDDVIRRYWADNNALKSLEEMKNGRAPFAMPDQMLEGSKGLVDKKLQLNHRQALEHSGGDMSFVYDFDNLEIVSPKFHAKMRQ